MKFLKIFKGKPLKRAEVKVHSDNSKVRLRASRTSGVNASYKFTKNASFNTKYGFRISKTIKGLTVGLRRGGSILRGRWGTKNNLLNLNLSKSGFSFSTSSRFGTYNWTRPSYSSFKLAGIQLRGKKAEKIAFYSAIIAISWEFLKYCAYFIAAHVRLVIFIFIYVLEFLLELLHMLLVDIPLLFNKKLTIENNKFTIPKSIPDDFREKNLRLYDEIIILVILIGPILFAAFAGFLEGYYPNTFGENGSFGPIYFSGFFTDIYIWLRVQAILYFEYFFAFLGFGFVIIQINTLIDWMIDKWLKEYKLIEINNDR